MIGTVSQKCALNFMSSITKLKRVFFSPINSASSNSSIPCSSGFASNYNHTSTYQDKDFSIIDLDSPSVSRSVATSSNVTLMGKFQSHIQNDGITGKN